MRTKRDRNSFQYYKLCTPREKNKNTGNISVNINDLANFDKDFLFDQIVNGEHIVKVINKQYVREHLITLYVKKERTNGTTYRVPFYAITVADILAA